LQAIGWYSINMSIVLAVLLVNTWVGYIFSVLNMGAATYIMELKYYVMKREMFETSGKNDFQESLSLERIYEKNEGYRFKSLMKNSLKVLNWNIERGFSPAELLTYIRKEDPDIVALQEVDWENERTDNLDVLEYMANELNMKGYYSIEFFEIDSPYRAKSNGGGGVHGNAILTKIKPTNVYRIELPVYYDWENPPKGAEFYAKIEKRIGKRFAICADFKFNTELLTVCSTHFEDKKGGVKGRIDQLNTIIETLNHQSGSESIKIIAGDMNTLDNWLVRMIRLSKKSEGGGKPWFVSECKWWKSEIIPKTSFRDPFTCKDWTHKVTALYRQKLDWILVSGALIEKTGIGDFHWLLSSSRSGWHNPIFRLINSYFYLGLSIS
ncbi:MAG: endonuclease/exonuclease/phosphatase family protein, partial [Anaerolineales bacterium]